MTRVLVTGGRGMLGTLLVPRLSQAGYTVRVMSQRVRPEGTPSEVEWAQADVASGSGVGEAVRDAQVVLHAASSARKNTRAVDVSGTARMLDAARIAGASHFIYISIVGVDRHPLAYYQAKLAAEKLVEQNEVPWTILRATQFHELIDTFLQPFARFPLSFAPTDFQFQPVDAGEVAARLVQCVTDGPAKRLPDMGGPEVKTLGEFARTWFAARGMKRLLVRSPLPGKTADAFRRGYNTCPENRQGQVPWAEWVKRKYEG